MSKALNINFSNEKLDLDYLGSSVTSRKQARFPFLKILNLIKQWQKKQ